MLAQLGDIVFQNLFAPQSWSVEGNENNFTEVDLIGSKPLLQLTGSSLAELNLTIQFHAEFCNPKEQLDKLEVYRNNGEVLPLLLGNGQLIGDYVIKSFPYTKDHVLKDGTIVKCTVQLQLKEYISKDKLATLKNAARLKATAVGTDIRPITRVPVQNPPVNMQLAQNATAAKIEATPIDNLTRDYEKNVSARSDIGTKIKNSCDKATRSLNDMQDKLDDAGDVQDKYSSLNPVINDLKTAYKGINDLMPSADPDALTTANRYLQQTVRTFSRQTSGLMSDVILRK